MDNKYKLGWRVVCRFIINLHKKDLSLLNNIKEFFGVGNVFPLGPPSSEAGGGSEWDSAQYRVESLKGRAARRLINHFDKYPIITKKQADYKLFKLAHNLIKNKSHPLATPSSFAGGGAEWKDSWNL